MGFLDKAKDLAGQAKDKVDDVADEHGDKIKTGINKAAETIDDRTKGKHSSKIESVAAKAKDKVDELGENRRR